ncbi:MAG TPA: hypothetical protein VGR73_23815 [Bryobacteraceae bacterium]|nr:hypothetical protein [Bryobacteraceae bacterium]
MFGSAVFEAVIGLVTMYLLVSLLLLAVNEWITRMRSRRSEMLKNEIPLLLGKDLAAAINEHALIRGLTDCKTYPSYIPSSTFALALIDIGYEYRAGEKGAPGHTTVRRGWDSPSQQLLEGLRLEATSLGPIQARIEKWFDLSMEHLSGKFKRETQLWTLFVALAIVGGANVDTLAIVSYLYQGALRHEPTVFHLFWPDHFGLLKMAGLILTWAAVSLGAPFWFDILSKLVNLRQTGLPPDENKRQIAPPGMTAQ